MTRRKSITNQEQLVIEVGSKKITYPAHMKFLVGNSSITVYDPYRAAGDKNIAVYFGAKAAYYI